MHSVALAFAEEEWIVAKVPPLAQAQVADQIAFPIHPRRSLGLFSPRFRIYLSTAVHSQSDTCHLNIGLLYAYALN